MSDQEKLGLFLLIVGLGLIAGRASAKLAQEIGVPQLAITVLAGAIGHGIANEFE
jgi:hypothetical protein